jgi:hypothetical protein
MPVIPATLRSTSGVPPARCAPVPAAVSASAVASRRNGSHRPVTRSADPPRNEDGPGHGLTGMRERVNAARRLASAGPSPDGGFVVSAVLPFGDKT